MVAKSHLVVAPEVAIALRNGEPVVALESTIISHGMPYPRNVETALAVESVIHENGAVPATIAIIGGRLTVGLVHDEIEHLGKIGRDVVKTSRRDIPFVVAEKKDGATTVAATMIIAAMAGIRIFATGGIGGVHRGVEESLDISADLEELSTTDVAVVCAGVKSILDVARTLEYLETKGVPVVGLQTDTLPAFYTMDSGLPVSNRIETAAEIAKGLRAKWDLGLRGGVLIAVPIPARHALNRVEIERIIENAISAMADAGVSGKDATPYLLAKIAEETGGRSLDANIHLVLNNAKVAAEIAREYAGSC